MKKVFVLMTACVITFASAKANFVPSVEKNRNATAILTKISDDEKDKSLKKRQKELNKRSKALEKKENALKKEIRLNKKEAKLDKKEKRIQKLEIEAN
jgi:hypothetical protein